MGGKEEEKTLADEELEEKKQEAHHEAIVLSVFMHCEACARKVRRCLKGFQGVESVETDCTRHIVVVRGEKADPLKVLGRLQTKTRKRVELISPIPNQKQQQQQHPHIITLLLKVHMHCHACAQHIKTRIHRIKGVESVEADLKSSQVRVKGAIDPAALLQYVHRTTGKHAAILNQELEEVIKPPPPEHNNNCEILLLEGAKHDDDHDKDKLILVQDKKEDAGNEKKAVDIHDQINKVEEKDGEAQGPADPAAEEEAMKVVEVKKSEYNNNNNNNNGYPQRYIMEMYPYPPPPMIGQEIGYPPQHMVVDAYPPPPPPVIDHAYPPQMFSDENPNACSLM